MDGPATHSLHKIRSESWLKEASACEVRRLRSMVQLSPPPDEPLPPLPPRSFLRLSNYVYTHSINSRITLNDRTTHMHPSAVFDNSSYSSNDSQGPVSVYSGRSSPPNTTSVHGHTDQEKTEFQIRSDSKEPPGPDDLGRLLNLYNRLKEMGASFTKQGEMQTYGDPPLTANLEQLLRLGTEYDELWNSVFGSRSQEIAHNLWPTLRVLKKMLQNEGIAFDDRHTRLNYGSALSRPIYLCHQYDVLLQEWFDKTLDKIHPAERWHQTPAQVEVPNTRMVMDSSFARNEHPEDEFARSGRRARHLTRIAEEHPSIRNGPCPTMQGVDTVYPSPLDTCSTSVGTHSLTPASAEYADATRLREPTKSTPMTLHGSSPLQRTNTANMLLADNNDNPETQNVSIFGGAREAPYRSAPRQHELTGVLKFLVEDERQRAEERQRADKRRQHTEHQSTGVPVADEGKQSTSNKMGTKSKALRKWLRTVLGLKKDSEK